MKLNEFINFRPNCLVCDTKNIVSMSGSLKEDIDESSIHSIFSYLVPVLRKDFTTFALANFAVFSPDDLIDIETLDKDKYNTLVINKDNHIVFDREFYFKMKFSLRCFCPEKHYSYSSRNIRVSDKSPDITKGYPVETESLTYKSFQVVSNNLLKTTSIFNYDVSENPRVIPYMSITSFPHDDSEKFVKKIENILLLA